MRKKAYKIKHQKIVKYLGFAVCLLGFSLCKTPVLAKTALDLGLAGVGARPLGMGKAYVAVADDSNALFMNPAGLSLSKDWQFSSMSTQILQMVDYKQLAGIMPTQYGTFGVGYISLSSPAGYLTTDKLSLSGATEISYGSSELLFSYGRKFGGISAGANLKFLSSSFGGYDASGSGYGLDVGVLSEVLNGIKVGASLQNIAGSISWGSSSDSLPSLLKLGVAGSQLDGKLLTALDVDFALSESKPMVLHAGVEYKPIDYVTVRGGLDQDPLSPSEVATNLTAGLGLKIGNIVFDYAYHQDNAVNSNSRHSFSISIFGQDTSGPLASVEKYTPPSADKSGELVFNKQKPSAAEESILNFYEKKSMKNSKDILSYYK